MQIQLTFARCLAVLLLMIPVVAGVLPDLCVAQETVDKSLVQAALKTYQLLLEEYRSGKAAGPLQLELLNTWSRRIWLAQSQTGLMPGASRAEVLAAGHREHVQRIAELERLVRARWDVGQITSAEVAAISFFRLEATVSLDHLRESHAALEQQGLDVQSPDSDSTQPLSGPARELFINITSGGDYFFAGKRCDLRSLEDLLGEASRTNPGSLAIIIRADKKTQLKHVVGAMNLCKRLGIRDYKLTEVDE